MAPTPSFKNAHPVAEWRNLTLVLCGFVLTGCGSIKLPGFLDPSHLTNFLSASEAHFHERAPIDIEVLKFDIKDIRQSSKNPSSPKPVEISDSDKKPEKTQVTKTAEATKLVEIAKKPPSKLPQTDLNAVDQTFYKWIETRLRAKGSGGRGFILIKTLKVTETDLPGGDGFFSKDPEVRFEGVIHITIDIYDASGSLKGNANVLTSHCELVPKTEDTSKLQAKKQAFITRLMNKFDTEMHKKLSPFIRPSVQL